MRFQVARAGAFYDAARAALPSADRKTMLPAEIMRAIYVRLLRQIEGRAFDVYSRPIRLSDARRLTLALGCWARHTPASAYPVRATRCAFLRYAWTHLLGPGLASRLASGPFEQPG